MKVKEGDYVRITVREVTPADAKSGLFYPYFCGLAGTVDRIYGDEVCVNVDLDTLPEDVLKRHADIQESMKRKWLNGLSGEARNRLTPEEKRFDLSYTILVRSTDLEKASKGEVKPLKIKSVRPLNPVQTLAEPAPLTDAQTNAAGRPETTTPTSGAESKPVARSARSTPKPGAKSAAASPATKTIPKETAPKTAAGPAASGRAGGAKDEIPKTVTSADLEAAELAFLKERQKALRKK